MFNRVVVFAVLSMFVLCLTGCGADDTKQATESPAAQTPPPKPVEEVPVYELTKDDVTSHEGWTSRNISVMGVKLGDKTRDLDKTLGAVENSRTLPEDYLTIHQSNGVFVYTFKLTGKARKIEIFDTFAKKIADEKLKKYFSVGDLKDAKNLKTLHDLFGMEEGAPVQNETLATDLGASSATEYRFDGRGFRLIQLKIKGGKFLNVLQLIEPKKNT